MMPFLRIWLYESYTISSTEVVGADLFVAITVSDLQNASVNDQMTVTAGGVDYDVRIYTIDYPNKIITVYAPFVSATITALAFNYTLVFWTIDSAEISKLSRNRFTDNMLGTLSPNLQGVELPTVTNMTVPISLTNFFNVTRDRTVSQVLLSLIKLRGKRIQVELVSTGFRQRLIDAVISEQILQISGSIGGEFTASLSFISTQEVGY